MRAARLSLLLALLWAGPLTSTAAPARLHLTTEHSPPDVMLEEGEVVGISTEKIRLAMARAGVGYDIDLLPWQRAYATAQQQIDTCVYSTTRTPERESQFKWIGPTRVLDWVLYGRADRNYKFDQLEDARALRIGVYNGDVRGDYLSARGYRVAIAQNDEDNAHKLMADRIDLWATAEKFAEATIARKGWNGKIVPVLHFNRVRLYLACNRAVPDKLVSRINAAFDAMNRDGSARRIEERYGRWAETKKPQR
jgi:polar amino acid transport system substrate-binding protein